MKNTAKTVAGKSTASARVVDGKLILSYPDALTPVVWQMDLATAKASALEVREVKNNFVLTLKTMKGETTEIAPFATKSDAVAALMTVSSALENAHGKIRPIGVVASDNTAPVHAALPQPVKRKRWVGVALAVVLIVVLIGIWGSMAPRAPRSVDNAAGGPVSSLQETSPNFGGSDEAGVPLSADEFLLKQQR